MPETAAARSRPYREAARHYGARPPYSSLLRPHLAALLGWDGRGRLLDIGCGPGVVALELAPSFTEVIGLDPEEEMLAQAQKLTRASEGASVQWVHGRAEEIPGLSLGRFNAVTLAQSFHRTAREVVADIVYDLLVPRGAMLLIHHETMRGLAPSSSPPSGTRSPHPPVPHDVIAEVLARYLPSAPPGPTPERHEVVLARTRIGSPERVILPGRTDLVRTLDEVIDAYLGTAFASPDMFGERLGAFQAELSDALRARTATGSFSWWPGDTEVLISRKAG